MFKKYGWLLCSLLLLAGLRLPAAAADLLRPRLSGELLSGDTYGSDVSLEIGGVEEQEGLLIKENGRWMSLAPGTDGTYRLDFTEDGDYRFRFCAETADGLRTGFADVHFTISRELASLLEGCRRLPDPETVTDEEVTAAAQELLALQRQGNMLAEAQRALIPSRLGRRLSELIQRLGQLQPQLDIVSPDPPQLRLTGEAAQAGEGIYRAGVRIEITPPQADFARLWMRTGEQWEALEPVDGIYAVECGDGGAHRYDFCAEDAAGNRSLLSCAEFILSPELFAFYESVGQHTGLGVEQALMRYQLFDGQSCSLVDEKLLKQLDIDYRRACEQAGHRAEDTLEGKELRVLGMLSGFYGRSGIQLKAQGQPVEEEQTVSGKRLLWEYTLSFTDGQGIAAEPSGELLVSVQLPSALLKKKNVTVLDSEGKLLETHVRNEDEGFVLTFPILEGGVYSVGVDPQ